MGRKGVSPVIATILMVAITVVLAAVLYVMVSGYMSGGGITPVSGALTYNPNLSNPNGGNATFELALSNPSNPVLTEVSVKILDPDGNITTNITYNWVHLSSDPTHLKGGDRMTITSTGGASLLRYEVIVTINPYSGTVSGKVPA
jgi:flagellin-like protein